MLRRKDFSPDYKEGQDPVCPTLSIVHTVFKQTGQLLRDVCLKSIERNLSK